jgi:hypothetical protein
MKKTLWVGLALLALTCLPAVLNAGAIPQSSPIIQGDEGNILDPPNPGSGRGNNGDPDDLIVGERFDEDEEGIESKSNPVPRVLPRSEGGWLRVQLLLWQLWYTRF